MTKVNEKHFGYTKKNQEVIAFNLKNQNLDITVLNYGGAIQSIIIDKVDFALGFDTVEAYEIQCGYIGALVGRCANRIEKGEFKINGKDYKLAINDGKNHLHGGHEGFDKKIWDAKVKEGTLELTYFSKDGEESYPGNMNITVIYSLQGNELHIDYSAICDSDTVCNLTNHCYFNLNGHSSGDVSNHKVQINSDRYHAVNENLIPYNEPVTVENTVFDFRKFKALGEGWDSEDLQIKNGNGYDHNFVVNGNGKELKEAVKVIGDKTGIELTIKSTEEGIQFYSGNYMKLSMPKGKDNVQYDKRSGFCFESQSFPNGINNPINNQALLKANEKYSQKTVWSFTKLI